MSKSSGSGNGHKILAAGAAIVAGEIILSHFGGPGLIVGLFAGPAAWVGIENYEDVSGKSLALPARAPRAKKGVAEASDGKLSLGRRLVTGKSYREAQAATANVPDNLEQATDEPEETYIDEDELDAEALLELGRGDELSLHVNTIFSHRVAVLGMSGGGKSNLIADFVEELGQQDAPLILLDYKGEYRALCAAPFLLRPVYVTAQNLTRQTAAAFARRVIDERLQVVVNLPSYEDTEAALVMVGLVNGVARYQEALRTEYGADSLIPCTFILEEAHYWLPQDASQSTLRAKVKGDKGDEAGPTVLAYLQQAFFKLSKIGRYLGMGLIVATQRPADVDNRLISQAEWYFLLKAMLPADLARYRGVGLPNDAIAQRLNPKNGEAYVIGPDVEPGVYHIRRRLSPDESQTPGLANIRRNAGNGSRERVGNTTRNGNATGNDEERREQPYKLHESDVPSVPDVPTGTGTGTIHARRTIPPQERERIIKLAKTTPRRYICAKLGKGKGYYPIVQQVLDEEGL